MNIDLEREGLSDGAGLHFIADFANHIACDIATRMKLVLDTDVMVAAVRSDSGASRQLLTAALGGRFEMPVSTGLLVEYEAVLLRPEQLAASFLSVDDVGTLLDAVAGVAKQVRFGFRLRPALRDADDDLVLEAAVNGGADAIVTFNVKDFSAAQRDFGLAIWKPGEALKRLEAER